MKFIKSDDEEVLNMLAQRSPQMKKAVGVLKELSADEHSRIMYEEREIARRDMVSLMGGARREGSDERAAAIARNMLKRNRPIDEIAKDTGLALEEIENLK